MIKQKNFQKILWNSNQSWNSAVLSLFIFWLILVIIDNRSLWFWAKIRWIFLCSIGKYEKNNSSYQKKGKNKNYIVINDLQDLTNIPNMHDTIILLYYGLILWELCYSVVWWCIVPAPTTRALFLTIEHYMKTVHEGEDSNMFST